MRHRDAPPSFSHTISMLRFISDFGTRNADGKSKIRGMFGLAFSDSKMWTYLCCNTVSKWFVKLWWFQRLLLFVSDWVDSNGRIIFMVFHRNAGLSSLSLHDDKNPLSEAHHGLKWSYNWKVVSTFHLDKTFRIMCFDELWWRIVDENLPCVYFKAFPG